MGTFVFGGIGDAGPDGTIWRAIPNTETDVSSPFIESLHTSIVGPQRETGFPTCFGHPIKVPAHPLIKLSGITVTNDVPAYQLAFSLIEIEFEGDLPVGPVRLGPISLSADDDGKYSGAEADLTRSDSFDLTGSIIKIDYSDGAKYFLKTENTEFCQIPGQYEFGHLYSIEAIGGFSFNIPVGTQYPSGMYSGYTWDLIPTLYPAVNPYYSLEENCLLTLATDGSGNVCCQWSDPNNINPDSGLPQIYIECVTPGILAGVDYNKGTGIANVSIKTQALPTVWQKALLRGGFICRPILHLQGKLKRGTSLNFKQVTIPWMANTLGSYSIEQVWLEKESALNPQNTGYTASLAEVYKTLPDATIVRTQYPPSVFGYTDAIWCTLESSVPASRPSNPVDIIEWLIQNRMSSHTPDSGSFSSVRGNYSAYSCDFAIFDQRLPSQLISDIAYQWGCGLRIDGSVIEIIYLPILDLKPEIKREWLKEIKWELPQIETINTVLSAKWQSDYYIKPKYTVYKTSEADIVGESSLDVDWFTATNQKALEKFVEFIGKRTCSNWRTLTLVGFSPLAIYEIYDAVLVLGIHGVIMETLFDGQYCTLKILTDVNGLTPAANGLEISDPSFWVGVVTDGGDNWEDGYGDGWIAGDGWITGDGYPPEEGDWDWRDGGYVARTLGFWGITIHT